MTLDKLTALCEPCTRSGPRPDAIGSLRQDSRRVEEEDVFVAVRGTQADGHAFIGQALERGASVIICENERNVPDTACRLVVDDTRALLGPLAQAFEGRPARDMRIIGITGTNGKTTVATLLWQVLRQLGLNASLLGTVSKRIGERKLDSGLTTADPIEIADDMRRMREAGSTHLVMEVSSHALDQRRTEGFEFEVAAFTNLSHDHLDYHGSTEAYAAAKRRLFEGLPPESAAVINADDDYAGYMTETCGARLLQFGFTETADIPCRILESGRGGLTLRVGRHRFSSPLLGRFNAYNLAQAFLTGHALGLQGEEVAEALSACPGAPGRLERVETGERGEQPLVLVDYAHTPDALEKVLETLAGMREGRQRLHVIFGCGGNRDDAKRPRMAAVAERRADRVTVTSDNPRCEEPDKIIDDIMEGFSSPGSVGRITDRREAIRRVILEASSDEIILIAGKGHETYQEIAGERYPFDDREIARRALRQRNGNPKTEEVA